MSGESEGQGEGEGEWVRVRVRVRVGVRAESAQRAHLIEAVSWTPARIAQ